MKRNILFFSQPFWIMLLLLCFPFIGMTQIVKKSVLELYKDADLIVLAHVSSATCYWEQSVNGRNIFTEATIEIEETLKGSFSDNNLILRILGGRVGDTTQFITNSVEFQEGENAIFFLRLNPLYVCGSFQGKFQIFNDQVYLGNQEVPASEFVKVLKKARLDIAPLDSLYRGITKLKLGDKKEPLIEQKQNVFEIEATTDSIIRPRNVKETILKEGDKVLMQESNGESLNDRGVRSNSLQKTADRNEFGVLSEMAIVPKIIIKDNKLAERHKRNSLKTSNTGNTYTIFGKIDQFTGVTDTDGDGYWENYSFYVAVDGNIVPGPETVYYKIICATTGQAWWASISCSESGSGVNWRAIGPFSATDFAGKINGNTNLDFTVEMWNADKTIKRCEDVTVDGEPVKVEPAAATTYSVFGKIDQFTGILDADGDGYWENFSFSVAIDGVIVPGPENVFYKIVCTTTGQSWWSLSFFSESGNGQNWRSFGPFTETDFANQIGGPTDLNFRVEMWNQTKTMKYCQNSNVVGQPIKIEPIITDPTISSISPDNASAGTQSVVTLKGINFGQSKGNGKVNFYYKPNSPLIEAPIVNWSSNEIKCIVPIGTIDNYSATASSGPVYVATNSGLVSSGFPYRVTYSYGGIKWPFSVVDFRINENFTAITGEGQAIQNAANTWNNAGSGFRFNYAGTHTNTVYVRNSNNDIMWGSVSNPDNIAETAYWAENGTIFECDITFNQALNWSTTIPVPGNSYDVQSTALHELGHWLGLRDLYGDYIDIRNDLAKVMFGIYFPGVRKATLQPEDIDGIQYIYPLIQPTVITVAITGITQSTATGGGNVTSDGGAVITARGVCWSTAQNPTIANSKTSNGVGTGIFTSNLTGLSANTTYYVRAYATNSIGTSYGNQVPFTTGQNIVAPTVTTTSISGITGSTANSGGNVTSDGGAMVTARGVCWSTSQNPTIANSKTSNGAGTGIFTSSITGLVNSTMYYVRAYATNSAGTSYGDQMSFATGQNIFVPTVTTIGVTDITQTTANGVGNVASDGGAAITARGVCWSNSQNPTIGNNRTFDGIAIGGFISNISGLTVNTTYYLRAYATNSIGTGYGIQLQFKTLAANGVGDEDINYLIKIYPNPAKDIINIDLSEFQGIIDRIELVNQLGQVVFSDFPVEVKRVIQVSTTGLASGLYAVLVTSGDRRVKKAVIIE